MMIGIYHLINQFAPRKRSVTKVEIKQNNENDYMNNASIYFLIKCIYLLPVLIIILINYKDSGWVFTYNQAGYLHQSI